MTTPPGLLPQGLHDRLPGEAAAQARVLRALLDTIEKGHLMGGYARVAPPLAEFEEEIGARLKSARTDLARFVDPVSQRTLAIRPDITPQIARIASTQMASVPRPLRLCYAGPVLKLTSNALDPRRESLQVGAELIGDDEVTAAREIVLLAVKAVQATGVRNLTVDLTLPDLVQTLMGAQHSAETVAALDALLDMKDAGGLASAGFTDWLPLMAATGPVAQALQALRAFDRQGLIGSRIDAIAAIADALAITGVRVTLDPTERHGFEYQSWFGFSMFVAGGSSAIGRGGSYAIIHPDGHEERAIGFSVYPQGFVML
jgi:ATP phosphoribosyltransferase regulatory subunit